MKSDLKLLALLVAFASLAVIGYGAFAQSGGSTKQQDEPCWSAEEATALSDAWVSAHTECAKTKDAVCTSNYHEAEEVIRQRYAECGNDQACKDGCDRDLADALTKYNDCIAQDDAECTALADEQVPGRPWPICQQRFGFA